MNIGENCNALLLLILFHQHYLYKYKTEWKKNGKWLSGFYFDRFDNQKRMKSQVNPLQCYFPSWAVYHKKHIQNIMDVSFYLVSVLLINGIFYDLSFKKAGS